MPTRSTGLPRQGLKRLGHRFVNDVEHHPSDGHARSPPEVERKLRRVHGLGNTFEHLVATTDVSGEHGVAPVIAVGQGLAVRSVKVAQEGSLLFDANRQFEVE